MSPQPSTMVHWIDQYGRQLEPEPYEILLRRLAAGAVPASTLVWWEGADGWTPLAVLTQPLAAAGMPGASEAPEAQEVRYTPEEAFVPGTPFTQEQQVRIKQLDQALAATPTAEQAVTPAAAPEAAAPAEAAAEAAVTAPPTARSRLAGELDAEALDAELAELVATSERLHREASAAGGIDAAMVAAVITVATDAGYALIEASTPDQPGESGAAPNRRHVRFEDPVDLSQLTVILEPRATADAHAHLATMRLSYGERSWRFAEIARDIWQEQRSAALDSGGPGMVTFDAASDTGMIFAGLELVVDLNTYVAREDLAVDRPLLARHLASIVVTLESLVHARFED